MAEAGRIRVHVCEDEAVTREFVLAGLARSGIEVLGVVHGRALAEAMEIQEPHIVILDIGLPEEDGFSIAERLRREHPHIGIIMLTARDQVIDRVRGLDSGADLYFAKPVDMRELVSAVGSLHRRLAAPAAPAAAAEWTLDARKSCLVTPSGVAVALTDNELRFLKPLLASPGAVVDREDLLRALEQPSDIYAMRRMETLLSRLRRKVQELSPEEALPVRARHGRGYAFLSDSMSSPS